MWSEFSKKVVLLTLSVSLVLIVCGVAIYKLLGPQWPHVHSDDPPASLLVGGLGVMGLVVFIPSMLIANIFSRLTRKRQG